MQDNNDLLSIFSSIEGIPQIDRDEPLWDKLIDEIIQGNVIPVIGPDFLIDSAPNPHSIIMTGLALQHGVKSNPQSFSQLVYDPEYRKAHKQTDIYQLIENGLKVWKPVPSKKMMRLLSTKHFPFVLTTSFIPVVERAMKDIWGDNQVKIMRLNGADKCHDIACGNDMRKPTVYYMFGQVSDGANKFAVTDTDMLRFVSLWLSSDDSRPKNLCEELKNSYLLMLGNTYNDWLFRFLWYSLRENNLGKGMLAYDTLDEDLVQFLDRSDAFTKQDTAVVVDQIITRLDKKLRENELTRYDRPVEGVDVFISYSRSDTEIAEKLYEELSNQGLHVWYDKKNITDGGKFMDEIHRAINTCRYFIPIISQNIADEKDDRHVYRQEWKWAISNAASMGRTFIIPISAEGVDFYKASIDEGIQQHNAIIFSSIDDLPTVAERIIHTMNEHKPCTKLK